MTQTLDLLRERVRVARLNARHRGLEAEAITNDVRRQYAGVYEAAEQANAALAEAEQALRAAAEAHYKATGEKKPVEGVAIRETVTLKYAEPDAIAWAKVSMPQLVSEKLDAKAFEKVAKAAPGAVPFVSVETVGKATIASELVPSPGYRPSVEDLSITGAPF